MKKLLIGLLVAGIIVVSTFNLLISDCPAYRLHEVSINTCLSRRASSHLQSTDTIVIDHDYVLVVDLLFRDTVDAKARLINSCMGPETVADETIDEVLLVVLSKHHDAYAEVSALDSSARFSFRNSDVVAGYDLGSLRDLYNDVTLGKGDFYTSDYSRLGFRFHVSDAPEGHVQIQCRFRLSGGRVVAGTKEVFVTRQL